MNQTLAVVLYFYLATLMGAVAGFKVLFPPHLEGVYNSPFLPSYPTNVSKDKPIVARLTGSFAETGPYEGTILLGCIEDEIGTMEQIIRRGMHNYPGIIGWMSCSVFTDVPGLIEYSFDGSDRSDIGIPVWDSGLANIRPIRDFMRSDAPNRTVIIEIDFDDVNEWTAVNDLGVKTVFSVVIGGYAFAVAGVAIARLTMFIRAQGPTKNLPQIILWIELFANLERGVYSAVDPLLSGRMIFPYFAVNLLPTITIPAYATTSLLITLYWKEVLSSKQMKVVTFLDKMKVYFFVFVSLTWAIEITNAFLRSFGIGPIFILFVIVCIFYFIVSVLTAIFFLYYGRKLLGTLQDPGVAKAGSSGKFKAVRMLITSAVFEIVYSTLLIMPATPVYFTPMGFFVVNFIIFLLLVSISLIKILAFVAPNATPKSKDSTPKLSEAMTPRSNSTSFAVNVNN